MRLVQSDLRPGADVSRTKAEIAVAETQTIQADRAVAEARILLEQMTGAPAQTLETNLSQGAPSTASAGPASHPALIEQRAAIEEGRARSGVGSQLVPAIRHTSV